MWIAFIKDLVPKSMQFINSVVILQREIISAFVSLFELSVESGFAMEWLVDISIVVDQKAESIRLCGVFIVWERFQTVKVLN